MYQRSGAWVLVCALVVCQRVGTAVACEPNEHSIDRTLRVCGDRAGSDAARRGCLDAGFQQWSSEVTRIHDRLMKKLSPDAQKRLAVSQQAWIKYQADEYAYIDSMHAGFKGTSSQADVIRARTDLVRRRAQELESHWNVLQMNGKPGQ